LHLNGFFKGDSPYILISVKAERPKIRRQINFLVDTGSDITGIATKDCLAMGISFKKLGRPVGSIAGLKGMARRWEIKNAWLYFIAEDKRLAKLGPMTIYIMETIEECPSLLGMDFFKKHGFKLVCNISNKKVYLEK